MRALLNHTSAAAYPMASGIANMGGATLDLAGGIYQISAPVVVPTFVGNVRIAGGGTLRAGPSFPANRHLIEIGGVKTGAGACVPKDGQNVCNEFITISDVFLDAAHVAAGGVHVAMTMGTTVTNSFVTGFHGAGILVDQGHETMVTDCWIAEFYWSEKHEKAACAAHFPSTNWTAGSVGITINGEDNLVTDVIIFDFTCVGILVNGAANLLTGVHSWNGGGVAISINGTYDVQDRVVDCYLDYSVLKIVNPLFVLVQGNFFYETHAELVGPVTQLVMRENTCVGSGAWGVGRVVLAVVACWVCVVCVSPAFPCFPCAPLRNVRGCVDGLGGRVGGVGG